MKKNVLTLLILFCGILLSGGLQAQREIQFLYDNSGNMTSRVIYIPTPPATQTENPAEPVDENEETENTDTTEVKKSEVFSDQLGNQDIKIYPNPTTGKLVIDIPSYKTNSNDRIDIVDMNGALKQRISPLSSSNTVNLESYPAATYIMLIHINGETTQWKIVKQ